MLLKKRLPGDRLHLLPRGPPQVSSAPADVHPHLAPRRGAHGRRLPARTWVTRRSPFFPHTFTLLTHTPRQFYELRWPRLTKTSREDGAPLSLAELQITAEAAMRVGGNEAASAIASIWQMSPALDLALEVAEWVRKLEHADRVGRDERALERVLTSVDQDAGGERRSPLALLSNFQPRPTPTSTKSSPLPAPPPTRALKRRRSSLPPPSLPPLSLSSSLVQALAPLPPSPLPSPLSLFFWSILPPPPGDLPTPPLRALQLNHETYLADPLAVLWAAGHRHGYSGERREGVVFVRGEAGAQWLRASCATGGDEGRKRVWVVKDNGFGEREREMLDRYLVDVL